SRRISPPSISSWATTTATSASTTARASATPGCGPWRSTCGRGCLVQWTRAAGTDPPVSSARFTASHSPRWAGRGTAHHGACNMAKPGNLDALNLSPLIQATRTLAERLRVFASVKEPWDGRLSRGFASHFSSLLRPVLEVERALLASGLRPGESAPVGDPPMVDATE